MYMDRHLEYERIGKDAAESVTRALPFGQGDLAPLPNAGTTQDVSPDARLYFVVMAGANPVPAGMTITIEHGDTETGAYETAQAFGPLAAALPGEILVAAPCPQNLKNWTRVAKGEATPLNIFLTYDVIPKALPTFPR